MNEDIFRKVGFIGNPFSPMGVTRGLDEIVPPPVGVRDALTNSLRKLEQSQSYHDNMILAVIGEYGSGKSELMKYLFRIVQAQGIHCIFTQFQNETLNLYSFLKKNTQKQAKDEGKHKRLIIFVDEIDDIPRMIKSNNITKSDSDRFMKDIRRFLERNDRFQDFKAVMLVLGFGTESWKYIGTYHPDISESRLKGFRIKLSSPEEWKMTGLIRRYIYFYASDELRSVINTKNPFYPFEEGYALALARLSALAHDHIYVNTRMLIKLMDRILLYLSNKTIEMKKKIIVPFQLEDLKNIIDKPAIIQLNEPDFESSIKQIRDSLKRVSKDLSKKVNVDESSIYNLLFRIYFDHSRVTDEEISEIVGERMVDILKEKLIEAGVVDDIYFISYDNHITDYTNLVKEIEYNYDNDEYKPIMEIRQYATYTDNDLERNNYKSTAVPVKEYSTNIAVKENDILRIKDHLKEVFQKESERCLIISKERWEREIKEKQIRTIEISGEIKALQLFDSEKPMDLMMDFTRNMRNLLTNADIAVLKTDDKNINDIVCSAGSPKNAYVFIKSSENTDLVKNLKNYMKHCFNSKENFEAITFLIPMDVNNTSLNKHYTEMLEKESEKEIFSERDKPILMVFNISKISCVHVIYSNETSNEKNHSSIIKEHINWVRDNQITIRDHFNKTDRIPLDARKFKKRDLNSLRELLVEQWNNIKNKKSNEIIKKLYIDIEKKYGKIFAFHDKQILSLVERDMIEILSTIPSKINNQNSCDRIHRRFALSCSILEPIDLLSMLELKGLVINKKLSAVKNYEFQIYRPEHVEREDIEKLKQSYNDLHEYLKDLQTGQLEFQNNSYPFSIVIPFLDDLNNIQELIYDLDRTVDKIESIIPPTIKEITSQNILEIDVQRQNFIKKYESIQKRLGIYKDLSLKTEENIENIENELKKIEEIYQDSDSDAKGIIEKQIRELPDKLQNIKTEENIRETINYISKINKKLSGVISTQKELYDKYLRLGNLCEDINHYLIVFEQLYNIEVDIWESVFGYDSALIKHVDFIKNMKPQELEKDYILTELPKESNASFTYLKWFKNETIKIQDIGEKITKSIFKETINMLEPIKNVYEWLVFREIQISKELEKSIQDTKTLYERLKSERMISGDEIKHMNSLKLIFENFMVKEFGNNCKVVKEIGREGKLRGLQIDKLKEMFSKEEVEKCLQLLIDKQLIIQSYTT